MKSKTANFVVNSYINTENSLADILNTIPYCREHEDVWSPRLVTVLLEACSQLDSLWKYQASQSPCLSNSEKEQLNIQDYFIYFGASVAPKWTIFWGEEAEIIRPYAKWNNVVRYSKLDWWTAYNHLKHNRISNRSQATLRNTVQALAGLFLAIIKCEFCRQGIAQSGWVHTDKYNKEACLCEDSPSDKRKSTVVESRLFSYPVGWAEEHISSNDLWDGSASPRFINWFNQYSDQ